jgi:hypothetical protein
MYRELIINFKRLKRAEILMDKLQNNAKSKGLPVTNTLSLQVHLQFCYIKAFYEQNYYYKHEASALQKSK